MPPLASWKWPRRGSVAPVNAPRRYPKSSDSNSSSGIAAQLTATNGLSRRGPEKWRVRASSSLPTPVSPWISTVVSSCAISLQEREDLEHLRALRDDVRQGEPLLVPSERLAALGAQLAELERPPQDQQDLVGLERLDQVVLGPQPGGLDRGADGAIRGHHDHADLRVLGLQLAHDLYAVHARQALVGQREVDVLALEEVQRLLAAARGQDLEALELEGAPQGAQEDLVILDDQHSSLHPALPPEGQSPRASPAPAPR